MEQRIIDLLAQNWERCGIEKGDLVLVHSSLKKLMIKVKREYDFRLTPEIVYKSFLNAIGEEGTLVLPLFNFDFPKEKSFDINTTPSQMGALTEIGRLAEGAIRTGHPIYSFSVIGKMKNEFKNIDNQSGYGADSPFAKIKELNGKIAIIGLTDQNSMTSYHYVEEQNIVDYRYYKNFKGEYTDKEGLKTNKTYKLFVRDLEKGVLTDVNRMMDYLWEIGAYKGDKYDEGFFLRTIPMKVLYNETEKKIRNNQAIDFLYSIDQNS